MAEPLQAAHWRAGTPRLASEADADVLAWLWRKRGNALAVAANSAAAPEDRARATVVRQFIDVALGDLAAGLHHGEAEAQAAMVKGEG